MARCLPRIQITITLLLPLAWLGSAVAAKERVATKLNQRIPDLSLRDTDGKEWFLHSATGKKAIVLFFLSAECPMSNAYIPPLNELAKAYETKGVAFIAINANPTEDAKQVAAHAKEYDIPFAVLRDEKQAAGTALGAELNSEVFLLDCNFVLRYRGRIDDRYISRLKKNARVSSHDLRNAIEELLAGKPVTTPVTKAAGCPIQAGTNGQEASAPAEITFNRDVTPILQKHCQSCHRPGEVGPFSLLTYQQAVKWSQDIKEYTQSRKMPPWKPVDSNGVFRDERRLTDQEIATLAKWVDSGTREGDAKDLPPPRQFPSGWQLGEPDLVLEQPEEMIVGGTGKDLFRCFVYPTNLTEDKWVSAVEVRPRNPRVVHHTINFVDVGGNGRKREEAARKQPPKADEQDRGPGYNQAMGVGFLPRGELAGWAPGQVPKHLPEGVGYYLPKNSDVVVQIHYHRTGKVERDRTRIGLYFAKKPVKHPYRSMVIPGRFITIPAGASNYKVRGEIKVMQDVTVYNILPHMHLLGKNIKATMILPDGTRRDLICVKEWDYNWQETYHFKEPIKVPVGTRFEVEAFYDNSGGNPLNPNSPPKPVRFGEQTTDEMCFVFLGASSNRPGRINTLRQPAPKADEKPDAHKDGKPAADKTKTGDRSFRVPYQLTQTNHILVRAKLNGKGPFNFILDTGAPLLFVGTETAKKIGLTPDKRSWATLDRFDVEGGPGLEKVKARVEDPFQLIGMNQMNLAGVRLDGVLGYTVLAQYRIEFDFTRSHLVWTKLNWEPPWPLGLADMGGGMPPDVAAMGGLVKFAAAFVGRRPDPEIVYRSLIGVELIEKDQAVYVRKVLAASPAAGAGLKTGDRLTHFEAKLIGSLPHLQKMATEHPLGTQVKLDILRGDEKLTFTIKPIRAL